MYKLTIWLDKMSYQQFITNSYQVLVLLPMVISEVFLKQFQFPRLVWHFCS